MHELLTTWLLKLGLKPHELQGEERETFDRWKATLDGEELTVEKIAEFCQRQKHQIEAKFHNLENDPQMNAKLILLHTVYHSIIQVIEAEEQERLSLEKHLQELIDNESSIPL